MFRKLIIVFATILALISIIFFISGSTDSYFTDSSTVGQIAFKTPEIPDIIQADLSYISSEGMLVIEISFSGAVIPDQDSLKVDIQGDPRDIEEISILESGIRLFIGFDEQEALPDSVSVEGKLQNGTVFYATGGV